MRQKTVGHCSSTMCVSVCVSPGKWLNLVTKNHSRQQQPLTHCFYDSQDLNVQAGSFSCFTDYFTNIHFHNPYDALKYQNYTLLTCLNCIRLSFTFQWL